MSIHRHTPALLISDARGLVLGGVRYLRAVATDDALALRTRNAYDTLGALRESRDPRLGEAAVANQRNAFSLGGQVLASHNVDAGWNVALFNELGQPWLSWDVRQRRNRVEYDALGRLCAVHEAQGAGAEQVGERIDYAGAGTDDARHNRCGRAVRTDHQGGSLATPDFTLTGQSQAQRLRLLKSDDPVDWPEALPARDALLETDERVTRHLHDALGGAWLLIDACGNRQRSAVDVAGQLAAQYLTLVSGTERELVGQLRYSALGSLQAQTAGNGVTTQLTYAEEDNRLLQQTARRADGTTLQALAHGYDACGLRNWCLDDTQPVRHLNQQRIDGLSTYAYDSFYRLAEATGRESLKATEPGAGLPELLPMPGGGDDSALANYQEQYSYDHSGNLLSLKHQGSWNGTRTLQVDAQNNRALVAGQSWTDAFDASGNQLRLDNGVALEWNRRNRLTRVVQLARPDGEDDDERYLYGSDGNRLRKVRGWQVSGGRVQARTDYLPGLELRRNTATGEVLQVIVAAAGLGQVRVLHWEEGQPQGIPDNNASRYSLCDLHRSSQLELDDQAQVISSEGYYPYGASAWRAARSAVEADYKTIRYSGQERDHSGLYYYGQRYYAPWVMRWVSADPGG